MNFILMKAIITHTSHTIIERFSMIVVEYMSKEQKVELTISNKCIQEMHSKMEKVEISQQINEVIYKRFMEKEQDERDKIIKSIKKYIKEEFKADNIIQFEFTEGECRVIGDKCIEAIQKLSKILQITYDDIVIEYPPEWENLDVHQSGTKLQYIKLDQPNHQTEFDDVKSKFLHQLNVNVQVETIERIQNSHLWENYYCAKKRIETKYKDVAGVDISYERLFFHATHFTDPKLVIDSTEGIDRRYTTCAGYGHGAYFAKFSNYSINDRFI